MIGKLLKMVKSSNKKRGRNITIGAVVGFLLSCTAVIGADEYLWIKEDSGTIKFSTDTTSGIDGSWGENPYIENTWNESTQTYENNMTLLGIDNYPNNEGEENEYLKGYGVRLSGNLEEFKFINKGSIMGSVTTKSNESAGIYNTSSIKELVNEGMIKGTATGSYGYGYGIYNSGSITTLINNGTITGESEKGDNYGIYNAGIIETLENSGAIIGTATESDGHGYGICNDATIGTLENSGAIIGTATESDGHGYGICNDATIGTLENSGAIIGTATENNGYGIYNAGIIETLENSGAIKGEVIGKDSYGIFTYSSITIVENLKNYGLIEGTAGSYSHGIYNAATINNLGNTGLIIGESTVNSTFGFFGIRNNNGVIKILENDGLIIGTTTDSTGYGIYNEGGTIEKLENEGSIIGIAKQNGSIGISNEHDSTITELLNDGLVIGNATDDPQSASAQAGSGIYNVSSTITKLMNNGTVTGIGEGYGINNMEIIGTLINTGVIYGKTNAIKNTETGSSEIAFLANYGILATKGDKVIDEGEGKIENNENYGLAFIVDGSAYKNHNGNNTNHNFGETYNNKTIADVDYTIRNVQATVAENTGVITDIKSFEIKDGELYSDNEKINDGFSSINNVILNGIENTLKVDGTHDNNILANSIINAYGTAIEFIGENANNLTLSGTIVNGGVDGTSDAVKGSDSADKLILQRETQEGLNTIINGTTNMGAGNDTLTVGAETQINGTLDGGTDENDILNFGIVDSPNSEETRILHDITGFENINVNSNVTFFEKTVADNGTIKDLEVTGATNITIGKEGVLTLRLDTTNLDGEKIKGHALHKNEGVIYSTGGKLLLALNGAGNGDIVNFGGTTLDGSLVTAHEAKNEGEVNFGTTSILHVVKRVENTTNEIIIEVKPNLPETNFPTDIAYEKLNEIYQGIISVEDLIGNFDVIDDKGISTLLGYLNDIYAGNPYSYSSELSRKSAGMFRDIVTENHFKPNTGKWLIYGGLTHVDGGTKDTYYGKDCYTYDIGSSDMDADTKITGAYMFGEYGVSDTLTSGVVIGGNKLKSDLSNGSKVDGSALYLGAYAKKYVGNLKVTAGAGLQYGDYDADILAVNKVASIKAEPVMKYSDNYNDITYDIYLNGRYSHSIGDNLFLEPYMTLSYTYIDQDGADEGSKALAIETDSKSFDYTVGKMGLDLKKVIPHEKGKSTLSAGVSYTKIFDGADEEHITGRFKGKPTNGESAKNFDILVAHKNEHSIGLNVRYALELENGVLFDVKGTYSVERDSNNNSGKNKTKGEWIVGAGLGYKF